MTEPADHLSQLRARLVDTVDIDERAELERQIAVLESQLSASVPQRIVDTGGGDYAEGNIDKRRVTFVAGDQYNLYGTSTPSILDWRRKLSLKLCDHSSALITRVEAFVGRKAELVDIQEIISQNMPTGGYVVIQGQAGQGKSSIMARLVSDYGGAAVAYHFIRSNPIAEYEVILLRDLRLGSRSNTNWWISLLILTHFRYFAKNTDKSFDCHCGRASVC